jgi:hypothetical protein
MDVLADPNAMKKLKQSQNGALKNAAWNLEDENFGITR